MMVTIRLFLLLLLCLFYAGNAYVSFTQRYIKPVPQFKTVHSKSWKASTTTTLDQNNADKKSTTPSRLPATLALVALITQTSALTIGMRMTRRACAGDASKLYIATTAVVMCETIKLLVSSFMFVKEDCNNNAKQALSVVGKEFTENWGDLLRITLPSALYVVQNNLQFVAVSNLPAEVFQVLIQAKIITTALCSVWLLQKSLTAVQWASVLGLTIGVGVVQTSFPTARATGQALNYAVGFGAVLVSCFTSGFAGVFFEKLMKAKPNILWLRNIEMSLLSIFLALFAAFSNDFSRIQTQGFFYGYNPMVLLVVFLQAIGGIIVSLVVKYTNSMTKGFATAGSIILSCLLSAILLRDCTLNGMFFLGTAIVCASTVGYSLPPHSLSNAARSLLLHLKSMVRGRESARQA